MSKKTDALEMYLDYERALLTRRIPSQSAKRISKLVVEREFKRIGLEDPHLPSTDDEEKDDV